VNTVLIADDESGFREILVEYLRGRGFDVIEAANGLETLLQVKHRRPGAVVLDLRMPRLGGLEALKRIRAFDAEIRVVVVSATVEPEVREQALSLGACAVLSKPIVLDDLWAVLGNDVSQARDGREASTSSGETRLGRGGKAPPDILQHCAAHVLIVDDDADMRTMLDELLARKGYRTSAVADATAALRAIVAEAPDVVLLDINMPGLTGTDALPAIRAVAPKAAVVMVSGTADADLAKRALAHGAFDYVVKPVDVSYLDQSLQTALAIAALN
jgi:DNA-binding NtrC family response regulator